MKAEKQQSPSLETPVILALFFKQFKCYNENNNKLVAMPMSCNLSECRWRYSLYSQTLQLSLFEFRTNPNMSVLIYNLELIRLISRGIIPAPPTYSKYRQFASLPSIRLSFYKFTQYQYMLQIADIYGGVSRASLYFDATKIKFMSTLNQHMKLIVLFSIYLF